MLFSFWKTTPVRADRIGCCWDTSRIQRDVNDANAAERRCVTQMTPGGALFRVLISFAINRLLIIYCLLKSSKYSCCYYKQADIMQVLCDLKKKGQFTQNQTACGAQSANQAVRRKQ